MGDDQPCRESALHSCSCQGIPLSRDGVRLANVDGESGLRPYHDDANLHGPQPQPIRVPVGQ